MIKVVIILFIFNLSWVNLIFPQDNCLNAYIDFLVNQSGYASPALAHFRVATTDTVVFDFVTDMGYYDYLRTKSTTPSLSKFIIGGYETLSLSMTKKELISYTHGKVFQSDSLLFQLYKKSKNSLLDKCFTYSGMLKPEFYTDKAITTLVLLLQIEFYVLMQDDESGDYYIEKVNCE
jgi:hypothetical protein